MTIKKNKLKVASVVLCILTLIGAYGIMVFGNTEEPTLDGNKLPIPKLQDGQQEYKTKLEALDALKEVRESNAPSIYDERLLDSTGVYDPNLLDKEKLRIVDSIYKHGRINYSDRDLTNTLTKTNPIPIQRDSIRENPRQIQSKGIEESKDSKTISLEHQLFFASAPKGEGLMDSKYTGSILYAKVDGTQTVQTHDRLQMRLLKEVTINGIFFPKNTSIYGFVSFKSNRTILFIENINHHPVKLMAFDFQDGSEGIYIENSFRAEATNEVIGDMVDDINVAGVPQISGVKKIFQRNNRHVKVTITDNYKLILKPQL